LTAKLCQENRKDVTNTDLNRIGNLPSLQERLAKWVIILENVPEQAMSNDVGIVSIREDLIGKTEAL